MISRKIVYNILTFLLTITLIFGVSIFTYGTFYFAYMPSEVFALNNKVLELVVITQVHDEEINFQFSPCLTSPGPCSFPNASLKLDRRKHRLMTGQPYRLSLSLELPESSENQVISTDYCSTGWFNWTIKTSETGPDGCRLPRSTQRCNLYRHKDN